MTASKGRPFSTHLEHSYRRVSMIKAQILFTKFLLIYMLKTYFFTFRRNNLSFIQFMLS